MSRRRQILDQMLAAESAPRLLRSEDPLTTRTTDALIHLGELAMAFGRIDRTACYHPAPRADGSWRKESDTDHTVMLSWLACALAAEWYPALNVGLVAQFALVHDAPEVYAGDTPTLRISPEGREAKRVREEEAARRLAEELGRSLPWLPRLLFRYESQVDPEARFVKALDKSAPKIVHLLDRLHGLHEEGVTRDEFMTMLGEQDASVASYAGDFEVLMDIRAELNRRVLTHPGWRPDGWIEP